MAGRKKREPQKPVARLRYYADENIDPAFVAFLRELLGANVASAIGQGFRGRDDDFHFQEARRQGRVLVTHDRDFLDDRRFPFQGIEGVVVLDIPQEYPGIGWIAELMAREILPSGRNLRGTKVVVSRDGILIRWQEGGHIRSQRVEMVWR